MKADQIWLERSGVIFYPPFAVPSRSGTVERSSQNEGINSTIVGRTIGTRHWYGWGVLTHPNQPFRSTSLY